MRATSRTTIAVICIVVISVCAVLLLNRFAGRTNLADLTQQKLYTLSPGTQNILNNLSGPVTLKLYYSQTAAQKGPEQIRFWNNYSFYVRDMLAEYVRRSNGKLTLQILDPRPFSDVEEEAIAQGIKRFPISGDECFYFGLAAANQYGKSKVIDFFEPERQEFVEYDLSKLISDLMQRDKRKVGVISSLPVMGPDNMSPYMAMMLEAQGQQVPKPWIIIQQLRQTYDVVKAEVKDGTLPPKSEMPFLIVIHPKNLDEQTRFAIDQYVMKGGKLLVFTDPCCYFDQPPRGQNPEENQGYNSASNLNDLLANWGLEMETGSVAVDRSLAGADETGKQLLPLMILNERCTGPGEVITGDLHMLRMVLPGVLQKTGRGHADIRALLKTTADAGTWTPANSMEFRQPSSDVIGQALLPSPQPLMLAGTIRGKLATNFPDGITLPPQPEEPKDPMAPPAPKPASKPTSRPARLPAVQESPDDAVVIVVADVDMLSDQLAYQRTFFGVSQAGDNATLILNALDYLAGQKDLISIRSRGRYSRPFKVVDQIERDAVKDSETEIKKFQDKIQQYQAELQKLGDNPDEKNVKFITGEKLAKRQELEAAMKAAQTDLRHVQSQRRQSVEALGSRLQTWNMIGAPSIILVIAVMLAVVRRIRARKWAARRN